ncbi:uncharacterized protein KIAA1143 homolog [Mizuhopecten yessoensis]|uniref:uncharacterized protein KIAA1143 homolog n=1 Tax=Mizuhopecten yessoensis TaxID=6573 RepID=UPI000B45A696|nr:uncharacterized protein KIAA1143 homolog [Mizuhopecten yessoensis]
MSGRGKGKNAISYVQNEEPAFIRQFKQNVGYKEGPNVDTKRQAMPDFDDDDDCPEADDEKPVVVVTRPGDLTAEQAEVVENIQSKEEAEKAIREGKITFKQPEKRSSTDTDSSDLNPTASKKKKKDSDAKKISGSKKVKNSKLLSFAEDDEDDET